MRAVCCIICNNIGSNFPDTTVRWLADNEEYTTQKFPLLCWICQHAAQFVDNMVQKYMVSCPEMLATSIYYYFAIALQLNYTLSHRWVVILVYHSINYIPNLCWHLTRGCKLILVFLVICQDAMGDDLKSFCHSLTPPTDQEVVYCNRALL